MHCFPMRSIMGFLETSEYKEFEEKTKNWTKDDEATVANEFMQLFVEFGQMKEMDPEDEQVQLQVRKLQDYIIYADDCLERTVGC